MTRFVFCLLALTLAPGAALARGGDAVPDCSQKFLAQWLWKRTQAFANMPKKPCRLYGKSGQYICDRNGCVRRGKW